MKNIYEDIITLRTCDFDRYLRITASSVLDLFQEVAGAHAESLGIGFKATLEKNLLWVLTKVKFEIIKQPQIHTKVRVVTWPLTPSKITLRREYEVYSEDGELLIIGSSEWVFMHSELRRIMPAKDVYPDIPLLEKMTFEEKFSKVKMPDVKTKDYHLIPRFSDIDMNSHVNNTKYASFVLDAFNPEEKDEIKAVQIDYHREVKCGNRLLISYCLQEKELYAKGESSDSEVMFNCKIIFA